MAFGTAKRFAKGSCMCFSKFGSPEVGVKIVTFAWKNFIFRGHMGPHILRATTPSPPPLYVGHISLLHCLQFVCLSEFF